MLQIGFWFQSSVSNGSTGINIIAIFNIHAVDYLLFLELVGVTSSLYLKNSVLSENSGSL